MLLCKHLMAIAIEIRNEVRSLVHTSYCARLGASTVLWSSQYLGMSESRISTSLTLEQSQMVATRDSIRGTVKTSSMKARSTIRNAS